MLKKYFDFEVHTKMGEKGIIIFSGHETDSRKDFPCAWKRQPAFLQEPWGTVMALLYSQPWQPLQRYPGTFLFLLSTGTI